MSRPFNGKWYRMIRIYGHPLSRSDGTVYVHQAVLYEKIGPGPHQCHWCGAVVNWSRGSGISKSSLIVDHLNEDRLDNEPNNLVPSCHGCNSLRRRGWRIKDGDLFVIDSRGDRTRGREIVCPCGSTRIVKAATKTRYCSRSCAARYRNRRTHDRVEVLRVS